MNTVDFFKQISGRYDIMLSAWPGMGNVGLKAIDYMRKQLDAKPFARIDMSPYAAPKSVEVDKGLIHLPEPPKSVFYHCEDYPVLFFESETQLSGLDAVRVINNILDVCEAYHVQHIFTGAAYAMPVGYQEPSQVFMASNSMEMLSRYSDIPNLDVLSEGQISGLNGLLLGYVGKHGMEAACFLATMPTYAVNLPNPKASRAIVEVIDRILDLGLNMDELNASVEEMEGNMNLIEKKVKEVLDTEHVKTDTAFPDNEQGINPSGFSIEQEIPQSVYRKIEQLFDAARANREQAQKLKEELDRWNLYKRYEDRFLDLFKGN